ncbi:MAG: hypothetical protein JXR51_06080 [Bacteroidales bacterium]|nr:hypothetical protein [Bacteroidales bacterium]MBN2756729.1 hypothetical protein [Bacteroidales bacterium]
MIKIYHNSRCKKSRAGLSFLLEKTKDFETIEYLKTGIKEEELKQIFKLLNKKPEEMIRKQEQIFKEIYKRKSFSDDEWLKIISENPTLLNRPIIIKDNKAVWGDPAENINHLF